MSETATLSKAFQGFAPAPRRSSRVIMLPLSGPAARWGTAQTLRAYSRDGHLASLVDLIADACLEPAWTAHKATGSGTSHAISTRKERLKALPGKSYVNLPRHEILTLLDRDTLRLVFLHWVLVGESFVYIARNQAGAAVALQVIPPSHVAQIPSRSNPNFIVSYEGLQGPVSASDMVHIVKMDPAAPLSRGAGLGHAAAADLSASDAVNQTLNTVFSAGARPSAVFVIDQGDESNPDALDDLAKKLEADYSGPNNASKIPVINGKGTLLSVNVSLKEQETVLVAQHLSERIRQTYRVPKILLGGESIGSRAQVESARYHFSQYVIEPLLEAIRHQLQTRLVPLIDSSVILDFSDVTPQSEERVLALMTNAVTAPAFSLQEVRALAGYPKAPSLGNAHILPMPGAKPLGEE